MKISIKTLFLAFIFCVMHNVMGQDNVSFNNKDLILSKWQIKSTVLEKLSGEQISNGIISPGQWLNAEVPTTVLNAMVKNNVYPDPRMDMNNYLIPDISDEFNSKHNLTKYSYLPGHVNPWKDPYWFKTEFKIPDNEKGRNVWLNFDGINYRAEVWLNGKKIADPSEMAGMFLRFKYNVTSQINNDGTNYLAVKIFPVDHPGIPGVQMTVLGGNRGPAYDLMKDLTLKISGGWDCALPVRDRNMGIYQDVYLCFTNNIEIEHPYIVTDLPLPDTTIAKLSISATLRNTSDQKQTGILKGMIDLLSQYDMGTYTKKFPGKMNSILFEKEVTVPANDTITVTLNYNDFPQLSIKNPYLWWPNGYGQQYLHNLQLKFEYDGKASAKKTVTFGIREVTTTLKKLNDEYGRITYINGKRIFCKGGWFQPDMLLDMNRKKIFDEARLLANANMNLVCTEDMPAPPDVIMEAWDKYGLLWWEVFYQCWTTVPGTKSAYYPLDHYLAIQNERDIILRCRNSPSLVVWCAENENVPGPDLYFSLKDDLNKMDLSRPFVASTSILWNWEKFTPYIKNDLPLGWTDFGAPGYTWHPTSYFFDKINEVKLQMFRNELGMPAVPTLSSIKKFIYKPGLSINDPLFPLDSVWAEHGAWDNNGYAYKSYDAAIRNYYGYKSKSLADYVSIAQLVNADGYRAMYEAANSRLWDITSGVMLWKLNSSSPDVVWNIYDWFLNPHAGYYYTRKACEPLHIQMNANSFQVSIINTYHHSFQNLKARAKLYDFNMNVKWEHEEKLNVEEDRYSELFKIPQMQGLTPVYFIRLELRNDDGELVSNNFYWQSSKDPMDYSDLSKLEEVKADLNYKVEETPEEYFITVKIKNNTKKLSFMNRLAVVRKDSKEEILPTIWDDNFVSLFPGETRTVKAKLAKADIKGSPFTVVIDKEK